MNRGSRRRILALVLSSLALLALVSSASDQSVPTPGAGVPELIRFGTTGTVHTMYTVSDRELTRQIASHTDSYSVPTVGPINVYLRIENVGNTAVVNPRITVNGGPNWQTLDSILAGIVEPGMSDDQKAHAIWQFTRHNRYHWWSPSQWTQENVDPVKLFNVYGYGFCTDSAAAMAAMFERVGLPSRFWTLGAHGEHQVSEAWYGGAWHMLEADRDGLYLERDNVTVAGVEDLIDDPGLVARAGSAHADLVPIYASTSKTNYVTGASFYATGHEIAVTLRPRETLLLNWQGTAGVHDDAYWNPPAPPIYGNGQITGRFDPSDPGYRQWIVRESGVRSTIDDGRQPSLGPALANVRGELIYRVDSPYPIVGATVSADLTRQGATDSVEVYVSRYMDGVQLPGPELAYNLYRAPGVYVAESNLTTYVNDGNLPPLHAKTGLQPSSLTYHVTPLRGPGTRVLIGGTFYRLQATDVLGLSISADGYNWQSVWNPEAPQAGLSALSEQAGALSEFAVSPEAVFVRNTVPLGYFDHSEDVTDRVAGFDSFYVRYEFQANSIGKYGGTAGLMAVQMLGVEPPLDQLVWSTASEVTMGTFTKLVDLSPIVSNGVASAAYHYLIRFVMLSPTSPQNVGMNGFTLTTTVQVAPRSLPALSFGVNQVQYSDQSTKPVSVKVTHGWTEYDGLYAPQPPSAPAYPDDGDRVPVDQPFLLSWQPAGDPHRDGISRYHVMICDDAECRWPLSSIFDVDLGDGKPSHLSASWLVPYSSWFNPGQTYYWHVKAQDYASGYWSDYSPTWSFRATGPRVRKQLTRAH
jgi:hypothetical protein